MASSSSNEQPLTLYNHPLSSYAQKVRIALREKNLAFNAELPPDLGNPVSPTPSKPFGTGPLTTANPRAEIPTLVLPDGAAIFDSTIILEYLEDRYPEPAFLPSAKSDPLARANARMIEDVCDTTYEALNWGLGELTWMRRAEGKPALEKHLREEAAKQTKVLQAWLEERLVAAGGMYFGGESFGWADICVGPIVNRSAYFGLGPEAECALGKWLTKIRERDSVKATFAEFAAAAEKVPDAAPMYLSGKRKRQYRDHRLEWLIKSGGLEIVTDGLKNENIKFGWP